MFDARSKRALRHACSAVLAPTSPAWCLPRPHPRGACPDSTSPPRHKLLGVYLPRHFAARDAAEVAAFVDAAGAADLVTFDGTRPVASLIPVLWDRDGAAAGAGKAAGFGRLLGHLALANPQ